MATRLSSPEGFVRGLALALALLSAVLVGIVWFAFNRDGSPNGGEPRELTARGPVHTSYVFSAGGGIQPIQFVDSNGKAVFEGDIVLGKTADLLEVARQV